MNNNKFKALIGIIIFGIGIILLFALMIFISKWWYSTVVNSNLPDWFKYVLLRR